MIFSKDNPRTFSISIRDMDHRCFVVEKLVILCPIDVL